LFSTQDEANTTHLFATSQTELKKYSGTAWSSAFSGPALTGGTEKLMKWDVSQNSLLFCQGTNQVLRVPYSGTTYAILNANCPAAYFITRFADRLYIASTTESAVVKPFRVRRSVNGDHTDWTGLGSGFTDLAEFPYHITGISKHGPGMIITTEGAIWLATRTGIAGAPARFDPIITDVGVFGAYTLKSRGTDHAFMGSDNLYLLTGNRAVPIGDPIRDSVFSVNNVNKVHMNFSEMKPDTQEWLLFLCTGENTTPDAIWIWNWGKKAFYPWDVSGPMCSTIHRMDASRDWDDLTTEWGTTSWEWSSSALQTNYPALMTGHSDGKVYRWSEEYLSDAGTAIACRWTSKDFTSMDVAGESGHKITLRQVAITYKDVGSECTLNFYFSSDGGSSWNGPSAVTFGGGTEGYKTANVWFQTTGDRVRFKFENNTANETFRIAAFNLEFEVRGSPVYA
tara:strand:+ start:198 stop:1556 length:1359 start_codon:yes stop_codon:yes gene_type:complete